MVARILVVDDEKSIRISVREFLRDANYEVLTAEDADQATEMLAAEKFDVVVTDIILPRITGMDLLKAIKKTSPHVQVILMPGEPTVETASDAVRVGAFDYLAKPIGKELLLKAVANAVKVKDLDDERRRLTEENRQHLEYLERRVNERTAALRESEKRMELALQGADLGTWDWNVRTDELTFNRRWAAMLGYTLDEIEPHRSAWQKLLHPEDRAGFQDVLDLHLQGKTEYCARECRLRHKSGEWIWVLIKGRVIDRDPDGKPLRACGTHHDISDRKAAERESLRLVQAIEQAAEAFVITDTDGTIQYVNSGFEQMTGYTREEAVGENPRILKSGVQDDAFYAAMWATLLSGNIWKNRCVNKKKDGSLYTENQVISPVRDASGQTVNYVAVKSDITEKLVLEEQFHQAQKMESVGKLAGGVAHDFNNMLVVILGYAELALSRLDPAEPLYAELAEIQKAARRSADITRQLLAFARKQTVLPRVLDLNNAMSGMLNMLQRLIGEDIDLAWLPGRELWSVMIDPSQVDQILANLCVNARDAIAGVGRVTIETGNVTLDESYCAERIGLVPGEYIVLSVTDDGVGMNKDLQAQIFEPFFTTKSAGEGTGLGLATVYGIVKQNEGFIYVSSKPDKGSTFTIYLPKHGDQALEIEDARTTEIPGSRGETVLLVEDEAAVLGLAETMLERLDYEVLSASTPSEAMELLERHPREVRLLITDVVMPDLDGRDLADRMLALNPNLTCLFMSGYPADVIASRGMLDKGVHFIQKPFRLQELASVVRELLDSTALSPGE